MQRPGVAKLSAAERQEAIAYAMSLEDTSPYKNAAVEVLQFFDSLISELQSSKLKSITELKRILLIKSEELKKEFQNQ